MRNLGTKKLINLPKVIEMIGTASNADPGYQKGFLKLVMAFENQ